MELRKWRVSENLTQSELGEKIGLSASQVCRLEAGLTQGIDLKLADSIIKLSGGKVSTQDLLSLYR